ncbi:MAG: hypothetical protein ACMG6E_06170 [Candidatus Roizmanbacteria bacterium]
MAQVENFNLSFLTGEVILTESKQSAIWVYSSSLRNSIVLETILLFIEELLVFKELLLLRFRSKHWSVFRKVSPESWFSSSNVVWDEAEP